MKLSINNNGDFLYEYETTLDFETFNVNLLSMHQEENLFKFSCKVKLISESPCI
jgi:hypothetical protein